MNRDKVIPLLRRGWASTKWERASLLAWTCCQVGERLRVGAWVQWAEGYDAFYESGWYLVELQGERMTWSTLWAGNRNELHHVKAWVVAEDE